MPGLPLHMIRLAILPCALVLAGVALPNSSSAEDPKPAPVQGGIYDPPSQPFRAAPMADSSRSVIVPLREDVHLAFDPHFLRTHTAWSGQGTRLFGPPYDRNKTPFLARMEGRPLWTMPPVVPWIEAPVFPGENGRTRATYRGLRLEHGVVSFRYQVEVAGALLDIQETPRAIMTGQGRGTARHFMVSPSTAPVWFLAHAEPGQVAGQTAEAVVIERASDFLTLTLAVDGPAELQWHSSTEHTAYREVLNIERGLDSALLTNVVGVRHALAWVKIPARPDETTFAVLSVPVQEIAAAVALAEEISQPDFSWKQTAHTRPQPEPLTVAGDLRSARPPSGDPFYRIESFPVPAELDLLVGGMGWLANGDLAVCTWPGEIYIVENATGPVEAARYRRFAQGLNEPLGLMVIDDEIHVLQKGELTRVRDTTGDGQADHFDTVAADWGYTGNYHAYAFGPLRDAHANFYLFLTGQRGLWEAPFQGWAVRVTPDGRSHPFAGGLRAPNGFSTFGPRGDLFVTDNQGNWIGACKLNHVQEGRFYGFPSSRPADPFDPGEVRVQPPAVWFPRRLSPSTSDIAVIEDARFGPFAGQMLVGDFQNGIVMRVMLEEVQGEWQGAVWPFARGFLGAVNRLSMGPDGQLYVGGCKRTWSTPSPQEFSLERVVFTGTAPFEVQRVRVLPDGFGLTFTHPVEPESAADPENYHLAQFNYAYHAEYGSPELDHDGRPNQATEIEVKQVRVSADGLNVRLRLEGWRTGYVTQVRLTEIESQNGQPLRHPVFYYTLNALPGS